MAFRGPRAGEEKKVIDHVGRVAFRDGGLDDGAVSSRCASASAPLPLRPGCCHGRAKPCPGPRRIARGGRGSSSRSSMSSKAMRAAEVSAASQQRTRSALFRSTVRACVISPRAASRAGHRRAITTTRLNERNHARAARRILMNSSSSVRSGRLNRVELSAHLRAGWSRRKTTAGCPESFGPTPMNPRLVSAKMEGGSTAHPGVSATMLLAESDRTNSVRSPGRIFSNLRSSVGPSCRSSRP